MGKSDRKYECQCGMCPLVQQKGGEGIDEWNRRYGVHALYIVQRLCGDSVSTGQRHTRTLERKVYRLVFI